MNFWIMHKSCFSIRINLEDMRLGYHQVQHSKKKSMNFLIIHQSGSMLGLIKGNFWRNSDGLVTDNFDMLINLMSNIKSVSIPTDTAQWDAHVQRRERLQEVTYCYVKYNTCSKNENPYECLQALEPNSLSHWEGGLGIRGNGQRSFSWPKSALEQAGGRIVHLLPSNVS